MEVTTEYLSVRILQGNIIVRQINMEIFKHVIFHFLPVECCLIDSIQILTKVLQDI